MSRGPSSVTVTGLGAQVEPRRSHAPELRWTEAGPNPAGRPGAVLIYPEINRDMRYEEASRRVVDTRNGEYLLGQVLDNREGTTRFYIRSREGEPLYYAKAYYGDVEATGPVRRRSFDVRYVTDRHEKEFLMQDRFPIERLADFLNLYAPFAGRDGGNVVIIDNRVFGRRAAEMERSI